jgi:hypothetical protein
MHGMRCAAGIPCVLPVLQQLSTRYPPVAVARSATLSRVNLANYRFENFVMSCCKSVVYMVIHLGFFINVKLFYYVYKTTSINHLHYFHDTHQSINRMAGFLDALRKHSVFILVLAWHEMLFKHDSKHAAGEKKGIEFSWTVLAGNRPTQRNDAQIRPLPLFPLTPHNTVLCTEVSFVSSNS